LHGVLFHWKGARFSWRLTGCVDPLHSKQAPPQAPQPEGLLYSLHHRRMLPVTLVKEAEWCPLIPWLLVNLAVEPPPTPSMHDGVEAHRNGLPALVARRLGYQNPLLNAHLESKTHGVQGAIDILAAQEKEVAEVKQHVKRLGKHHIAQLQAYTLLAVDNGYQVRRARIETPHATLKLIDIDHHILQEAEKKIERLWDIVENPDPPYVNQPREKCQYCRYRRICPYANK
jgi:CRISPR-associated exonuclease Cas4